MIPDITNLQFFVLAIVLDSEQSGRYIREAMKREGQSKTPAAFYQLMARLEEAGLVKGRYITEVIDGQTLKERHYKITGSGVRAVNHVREFQARLLMNGFGGLANA